MKTYLAVVECVIEYNNTFLIIRRPNNSQQAAGLLSLPGGTVEALDEVNAYDMLRSAIKREIFEELGFHLKDPIDYLLTSYFVDNKGRHVLDSIFHHRLTSMPTIVPSPTEVPAYYWMTIEEINTAPHAPEWLKKYIGKVL